MDLEPSGAMIRSLVFTLCLLGVTLNTPVHAQLRVLLGFDETGHHVHQIVRVVARKTYKSQPDADRNTSTSMSAAISAMQPGEATLVWQDAQLEVLEITQVPDPRIVHSAASAPGVDASWVGSASGAWLVDGPDNAEHVVILLPENPDLQLVSERWPLWLLP